ncbi:transcriptional regulator [Bacillus sp. MUM 116]|uniref:ArsR/SmtB family transcription factor n=1 Tax=Bacillus sp. MUM 116 TaxID=1678002 RepID=UPI0008F5845A|nr:metalloregulator ArsR/SmtB family transcription factor [Bacillus sp. MUM 116]OIK09765.1 transcriptional regulator [Bacillus sp. MUM 116]
MEKEHDEKVLAALADPTRRQLLDILAAYGEASATTLATQVTISRQAVVKHLSVLEKARLVSCDRVGREMRYTVCTQQLESTAQWMVNLANDWDRKLKSIKHKAEMDE